MMIFPTPKQMFNPYPFYKRMRIYHPIVYDDKNSVWGIFRYKDIKYVLTDHANFSSDLQKWRYPNQEIHPMLITSDPPVHKELYSQVSLAFTPSIIAKFEPRIEKITQKILNKKFLRQS